MTEVKFGGAGETPANSGDEVVVKEPVIEQDGDNMKITVTPEQAEAVKKMLAEQNNEPDPKKPEWLGDFESPEEMAKAYKELRTKMSKGDTGDKGTEGGEGDEAVEKQAEEKGVDLAKYAEEWNVNQSLSSESYAELAAKGFTKEIVDGYIAGKIAQVEKAFGGLYTTVGGEDAYANLIEWGKVNLPQHAQAAYDNLLNTGQYDAAALALRGFVQQYRDAVGTDPLTAVKAGGSPDSAGAGVQGFPNKSAMIAAINDRRYKEGDKAYIAEVEKRIIASNFNS